MRNRFGLAGALVLALGVVGPGLAGAADQKDRERGLNRKVEINPVAQSTGVSTGLVIAHGHVIAPPYRFSYAGSTLLVNGVQLIPSPIAERESEKIRARISSDKRKLFDELGRIQARARKMFEERRSHEEILQYMKAQTAIIADAKWESEKTLALRLVGSNEFTQAMWFTGLTQETKKQAQATSDPKALQAGLIDQYERDLAAGACLVFTSDNGVMRMDDPRDRVVEVMRDKGLSPMEREEALSKIFPMNRIAVYDVLANFSMAEWTRKEK